MKVKIISAISSSELENEINNFLKKTNKEIIDIKYQYLYSNKVGIRASAMILMRSK